MTDSSDPSLHRQRQELFIQHVERLLEDDRLRLDTTRGRRPVTSLIRDLKPGDKAVELTRLMSELNKPDRGLRDRLPADLSLEVVLSRQFMYLFKKTIGQLKVVCVSPNRALINGESPRPMTRAQLADLLRQTPPPQQKVPSTLVIMSTSGFAIEANELAERRPDRTVVLVAPNREGGWTMIGPPETKALTDLFDPEAEDEKRQRIRAMIEEARADLTGAGVASDRVAARTQLPATLIEAELKRYAKENVGLVAKRLDGRMVLFRQAAAPAAQAGGGDMPLIDRMKALFARKGETEKKIAFLAERRTALSQQRDRGYEEMNDLESREADLREQFKQAAGELTKRRVTGQLLQLRKDIERRQQLMSVLNQQINVVAVHLHNLELVQQGQTAKLPDSEEMATDAAAAEEMIAELQANSEMADSVGGSIQGGLSAEEQALYEELSESSKPAESKAPAAPVAEPKRAEPARVVQPPQRKATPEAE
jgi:hypothetical protein